MEIGRFFLLVKQGCTNTGRLNSDQWRLIFMGPWYGTYFISPPTPLEFGGGSKMYGKFVHPCIKSLWTTSGVRNKNDVAPLVVIRHL